MPLDPVLRKILDSMPDMRNFDYGSINIEEYRRAEAGESRKTVQPEIMHTWILPGTSLMQSTGLYLE